jgi:site-specific DNA-methyltransferase (adenine-specific)
MQSIPDASVDMILCDLPYGTTQNQWDSVIPFASLWDAYTRICKGAIVLTAAQPFTSALVMSNPKAFKYSWVWRKPQGTGHLNAKKQPLRNHEDVLVFYSHQPVYNPQMTPGKPYHCKSGRASDNWGAQVSVVTANTGYRYPLTVLEFGLDKPKLHPTQKPAALFEYLIRSYTHEGMTVLDNCAGSGTTAIACINSNRRYICIEQDQTYYDRALARIEEHIKGKSQECQHTQPSQ